MPNTPPLALAIAGAFALAIDRRIDPTAEPLAERFRIQNFQEHQCR